MDERMKEVLAVLLAEAIIGGNVPRAVGVIVLRDDGVGYVWRGDPAQTIAAVLGRAIASGTVLPTPETHHLSELEMSAPKGETRH